MSLETFFKQFEHLAEAPNGVQKLRELILQLAVQGKLVPQDPNDEPASVLIKRIRVQREHLVKAKKINKVRAVSPITDDEVTYELPNSWEWVRLAEVGHDWGQKKPDAVFTYIDVSSINKEQGVISDNTNIFQPSEAPSRARKLVCKGTVIYATVRPYLLNIAIIDRQFEPDPIVSTAFAVIHPFSGILNKYLYYYLRSKFFVQYVEAQMKGMAYPAINDGQLYEGLVPIPPSNEQQQIVSKIEQLMKLCDELEDRQRKRRSHLTQLNDRALSQLLTAATPDEFGDRWQRICNNFDLLYSFPKNIIQLRQAILQLAVQGKLVLQNSNAEPASALLASIRAKKETLVTEKKISKEKPFPKIDVEELPFEVPPGWVWVRIGEISKVIEYGTSEKSSELGDVPVFRMNNIRNGKVLFENLKFVSASVKDLPRLYLQHGDLMFNRTNSYELVGKTGVYQGESNQYTFASYLIRVSLFSDYVMPRFINIAMNSAYFRYTQIEPEITQQCGQANFNGTKLKNAIVPLPPIEEQKQIVTKVDRLMELCNELEAKLLQTQTNRRLMKVAVHKILTV